MRTASIYMIQWLDANERTRIQPYDQWYLDFARKLLPLIKQYQLFGADEGDEQTKVAITLSLYLQDAIAQTGGWKEFTDLYRGLYQTLIPFYPVSEQYVADEINPEDIAFILWTWKSRTTFSEGVYAPYNPFDTDLLALAQEVYKCMDAAFEDAPISEEPSPLTWVMGLHLLEIPSTPLPEITPDTKLSKDAKRCLEYSDGKQLLYFATYNELRNFFVEVLKWENNPSALLPDLENEKEFVIYANAKGILIAPGVAAYFREAHNPLYKAELTATEGCKLFYQSGACPFDLLKYGMAKGLLSEAQLPFPNGKELLHQYWDFIARYYLCEYYEGE